MLHIKFWQEINIGMFDTASTVHQFLLLQEFCLGFCHIVTIKYQATASNRKVPGLMPNYANLVLLFLILLQYTQLCIGALVSSGEAANPAVTSMGNWCLLEKQMQAVLISLSGVGVIVEFRFHNLFQ